MYRVHSNSTAPKHRETTAPWCDGVIASFSLGGRLSASRGNAASVAAAKLSAPGTPERMPASGELMHG